MARKPDTPQIDSLGRRLLQARLAQAARWGRAITQSEIGRNVGVTGVTIGRYEADRKEPSLEMIVKLATELECDPGWLAFGKATASGPVDGSVPGYMLHRSASLSHNTFYDAGEALDEAIAAAERGAPMKALRLAGMRAVTSIAESLRRWWGIFGQEEVGNGLAQQLEEGFLERLLTTRKAKDLKEVLDELGNLLFEVAKSYEEAPVPGLAHSLEEMVAAFVRDEIRREQGKPPVADLLPPTAEQLDRASFTQIQALAHRRDLDLDEVLNRLCDIADRVVLERVAAIVEKNGPSERDLLPIAERALEALTQELGNMIIEGEQWAIPATRTRAEMAAHVEERIPAIQEELLRVHRYTRKGDVSEQQPATTGEPAPDVIGPYPNIVERAKAACAALGIDYPAKAEGPMPHDLEGAKEWARGLIRVVAANTAFMALEHFPNLDPAELARIVERIERKYGRRIWLQKTVEGVRAVANDSGKSAYIGQSIEAYVHRAASG